MDFDNNFPSIYVPLSLSFFLLLFSMVAVCITPLFYDDDTFFLIFLLFFRGRLAQIEIRRSLSYTHRILLRHVHEIFLWCFFLLLCSALRDKLLVREKYYNVRLNVEEEKKILINFFSSFVLFFLFLYSQ